MPLIYILSNRWYIYDSVYKVGKHNSDDINNLLRQYTSRYIPLKQLLYSKNVHDCDTVEAMVHDTLSNTHGIDKIDGEWYRGDIDDIISVVDTVSDTCIRDPYALRIDYEDGRSITYPLSHVSNRKLYDLGLELGIDNIHNRNSPMWRDLQIRLLFYQNRIIEIYESDDQLDDRTVYRWRQLIGYHDGDDILHTLYKMVNPYHR